MIQQSIPELRGFDAQLLHLLAEHGRPVPPLQLTVELGTSEVPCGAALQRLSALGLVRTTGRRMELTPAGFHYACEHGIRVFAREA